MIGKIKSYAGFILALLLDRDIARTLRRTGASEIEFRIKDPREITREQQKKAHALIGEIGEYRGYYPWEAKLLMKYYFCEDERLEFFSLSNVDRTIASAFIDWLIEFCFRENIPTPDPMQSYCDDIERYLYHCLDYRKCALCNDPADIYHVKAIGMGRNRSTIIHLGCPAMALCRVHHTEAEKIGRDTFYAKHHVYGIPLDEYLCERLKMNTEERRDAIAQPNHKGNHQNEQNHQ